MFTIRWLDSPCLQQQPAPTAKARKAGAVSVKSPLTIPRTLPLTRWFWGRKQMIDTGEQNDGRPEWWVKWNDNILSVWRWENLQNGEFGTPHELSVMTVSIAAVEVSALI